MRRSTAFLAEAMVGYLVLTALLVGGAVVVVRRLAAVTSAQTAELRVQERQLTIAERLRWSAEFAVSAGRGYLISGDEAFLVHLREARDDLRAGVHELGRSGLTAAGRERLAEVEGAASSYFRAQDALLAERETVERSRMLADFERELLPHTDRLFAALNDLAAGKLAATATAYERAEAERGRLARWLYALVLLSLPLSLALAFTFSRMLARSYDEARRSAERARRAVQSRDDVMGMVAHDLRNPLASIKLAAAVLRRKLEGQPAARQAETIERVVGRLDGLVGSMLDAASLEAGRFSVTVEPCDAGALVRDAVDAAAPLAASRQLQLTSEPPEPPVEVLADRDRVAQVLANLLGNALKFTPPGGSVAVAASRTGDRVTFRVTDTGPGIDAASLPHLFDRYWKRETLGVKGTGLGLFIAKGIVDAHGGRLWAESPPGRGATLAFTLAVAPSMDQAPERRAAEDRPSSPPPLPS